MNTIRRKVLMAGIVAIFAFIATIGATYAWFTLGNTSEIQDIQLQVSTDVSLLIMMDNDYNMVDDQDTLLNADNYSTELTNALIKSVYDFTPIVLAPVTTNDGLAFLRNDRSTPATSDPAAVNPEYLEFSVWLYSQDKAMTVAVKDVNVTANNPSGLQNLVRNAVRLSIYSDDLSQVAIYGKDKDYDFTFGVSDSGYDPITLSNNSILPATESALSALEAISYVDASPIASESTDVLANADTVLTLAVNAPEKVTIRIWIEGWDSDANNNILEAAFAIQFGFIVKEIL